VGVGTAVGVCCRAYTVGEGGFGGAVRGWGGGGRGLLRGQAVGK